ncbi:restriction endonuclease subunit S [Flavobacterium sp. UBA7682]|uniref:restriction endonuclease subunit S n=1 Tax=Flavobacterium sp. UBA7682 TaxID=1946560 RepID=UPI0025C70011|nr:restriction endonuclease subunit S [Flavobacterium sp. UBA7682]
MKGYNNYKDSGIEWIGKIPNDWKVIKLKWLTQIKRGASPRPIDDLKYFDENGEFSWVRIADVSASERYLENTKEKLSELGASLSVKQYPGDFFLSIAGSVGKPIITKIKCCIHDGFVWFPELKINPEYLYYIFQTGLPFIGLGKIGTQLNLNTETIGNIVIPNLSNEDIKKIVFYLDYKTNLINTTIEKKKRLIELLKEKRQAVINEAVTKGLNPNAPMKDSGVVWLGEIPVHWEVKKLKYLAKIRNGKDQKEVLIEEGGYPVLGTGGVFGRASEFLYDKPSVLLGRKGTIDKPFYIEEPFWTVDTLFYTEIYDNTYPKFLFYLSTTIKFDYYQESSAVPSMTQDNLNNIHLCYPPYEEQVEIVNFINDLTSRVDLTLSKISTQIENMQTYRQSLISEAVTGKIDVRDWQPNTEVTQ